MTVEDPRPTLDLLWNGIPAPRRGPRHRLTIERIVGAATAIAEEDGVAGLSMRRVAARLGVSATSLYTYVPDKSALLALMLDTMLTGAPLPHTLPGSWRDRVAAWARSDLRDYRAHPWLVDLLSTERPMGPGALTWFDSALRVFAGTGLRDREILAVIEAVESFVRGHAVRAVDADRIASRTTPEGTTWSQAQDDYLAMRPEIGALPAVAGLTEAGPGVEEVFEQGLAWLLDGIEGRIRAAERRG